MHCDNFLHAINATLIYRYATWLGCRVGFAHFRLSFFVDVVCHSTYGSFILIQQQCSRGAEANFSHYSRLIYRRFNA